MKVKRISRNSAAAAWYIFSGLIAFGVTYLVVRELPSVHRELRLMRM